MKASNNASNIEEGQLILFAFIDTNIILEGRPLQDLPWSDIQDHGTIRALILPKVMEEIDSKKRDGRLGRYARAFNQLIATAVLNDEPVVVRGSQPRVELSMVVCDRIPWDEYDELDPEDGDSRIVAEALHARGVDLQRCILVSQDIKPLFYARGRSLRVHQASEEWLRPIEPSPKDKEIQRLKQQVATLQKTEPCFEISIEIENSEPLTVLNVDHPSTADIIKFTDNVIAQNRPRQEPRRKGDFVSALSRLQFDATYDDRYQRYIDKAVPAYAQMLHKKMELLFNQRPIKIRISNVGQIRADYVVISVEISGGWLHDRFVLVSLKGPSAPTVRYGLEMPMQFGRSSMPRSVSRHEFAFTKSAERSDSMEVTCEDFRHGHAFVFDGVAYPTPGQQPLAVKVRVTAANLHGEVLGEAMYKKEIVNVAVSTLMDLERVKIIKDFTIQKRLYQLLADKKYDRIDFDKSEYEVDDD